MPGTEVKAEFLLLFLPYKFSPHLQPHTINKGGLKTNQPNSLTKGSRKETSAFISNFLMGGTTLHGPGEVLRLQQDTGTQRPLYPRLLWITEFKAVSFFLLETVQYISLKAFLSFPSATFSIFSYFTQCLL